MSNKSMKVLEAEDGNYNVLNFFFSDRSDFVGIFKFRETGFFFFFFNGKIEEDLQEKSSALYKCQGYNQEGT